MNRVLCHLRHQVGRRGIFLLFLALLDAASAYRLAWPDPAVLSNRSYQYLASIAPLNAWSVAWFVVAAACLVGAFMTRDAFAFAAAAFLKFLWAAVYVIGWILYDLPQGYFSAVIWAFAAVVVLVISTWPEFPEPPEGET